MKKTEKALKTPEKPIENTEKKEKNRKYRYLGN